MNKLYIIIPAYNEEKNLEKIVSSWYQVFDSFDISNDSKFVVINDGSKDSTSVVGHELEKKYSKFKLIDKINQGHGATVLYGYRYAIENDAEYVFQTDSDGQTDSIEFINFWNNREKYDAIFGVRSNREDGKIRVFVEKVVCLLVKIIFGVSVPDANAPFRLMNVKYLEKYINLMPHGFNLPNIILTSCFVYFKNKVLFSEISFGIRKEGVNSINLKRIMKIGRKAIGDFICIKKNMLNINNK